MNVQVGVDFIRYNQKPGKFEIVNAKKRAAGRWKSIDVCYLAKRASQGYAFLPGHLVGGISSTNCVGMQVFALDFDTGISFTEIQERCRRFNLPIAFAYYTFNSSKELEKFRVVFVHQTLIEDIFIIKVVVQMFHKVFPECDKNCTNFDRVFLGGKELICCDKNATFVLVQLLSCFYQSIDKNNNYLRNLENFCNKQNILMINKRAAMGHKNILSTFDKNDDFMELAIIHIIDDTTKSSFFVIEKGGVHTSNIRQKKRTTKRIDIPSVNSGCHLLDDFMKGERLDHNERFLIVSNLRYINGGEKNFFDILEQYYGSETVEKWVKDLKYMCDYKPMRCSADVCPYFEICNQKGTIVDTITTDRRVEKLKKEIFHPIVDVEKCLKEAIESAYNSKGNGVHLIKAQTSIGKTTQYINLITRHPESNFLIALPTNILKEEVKTRLIENGVSEEDIFMTLSISNNTFFIDERESIQKAHVRGIHNKQSKILKEILEENKDKPDKKAMNEECEKLIMGINAIKDERVVVTTHAALLQMSDEFLSKYTIIVDEDILQLSVFNQMYMVHTECLKNVIEQNVPGYSQIASNMLNAKENEYKKIIASNNLLPLTEEEMAEFGCGSNDNINDIKNAESFVKIREPQTNEIVIKYFCPHKFAAQKYIILSATLNKKVYSEYFGGVLPVYDYDMKQAVYEGKVVQYTYHSLGRKDLSTKMKVFDVAKDISGKPNLQIITFKEGESIKGVNNKNNYGLHFGNAIGVNSMKGLDIGIVGTPYKTDDSYKLIACFIGANVNAKIDAKPRPRRVEYKGYSFYITTYSDEVLREVQLYALESELEQCVGRARLLRKNSTVYVFSAFPCEQAEIHMENYLDV